MNTDPISAATAYKRALERIAQARALHEARQHAEQALDITFAAPSYDEISVQSGLGSRGAPFVSLAVSNPVLQMPADKARAIGLQLVEAADAAESDGFIVGWIAGTAQLSQSQIGALLADFRAYRERMRGKDES